MSLPEYDNRPFEIPKEECNHSVKDYFSMVIWDIIVSYLVKEDRREDASHFFNERYDMIKDQYALASILDAPCLLTSHKGDFGSFNGYSDSSFEKSLDYVSVQGGCYSKLPYWNECNAEKILLMASENGSLSIVNYLLENYYKNVTYSTNANICIQILQKLMAQDDIEIMEKGSNTYVILQALNKALENNHVNVVKVLLDKIKYYNLSSVVATARSGSIEMMRFLKEYHYYEIFSWYNKNIKDGVADEILEATVQSKNLDLFKYLVQDKILTKTQITNIVNVSSKYGCVEFIEYFLEQGELKMDSDHHLVEAIKNGHKNIFNILYRPDISPCNNKEMLFIAGCKNDLETFIQLRDPTTGSGEVDYNNIARFIPFYDNRTFTIKLIEEKAYDVINFIITENILKFKYDLIKINDLPILKLFVEHSEYNYLIINVLPKIFHNAISSANKEMTSWIIKNLYKDLILMTDEINRYKPSIHSLLVKNKMFEDSIKLRNLIPKIEYNSDEVKVELQKIALDDALFIADHEIPNFIHNFPEYQEILDDEKLQMLKRKEAFLLKVKRQKRPANQQRIKLQNMISIREVPHLNNIDDIAKYREQELQSILGNF